MMRWTLLKVLALLLGALCLVFAFLITDEFVGSSESSMQYGGAAYTGIQNAAAQTANNVRAVGAMIQMAACYLLLAQGLTFIALGICIRTKPKKAAPTPAPAAPVAPPQSAYAPMEHAPVYQQPQQPLYQNPYMPPMPNNWNCTRCGATNEAAHNFCQNCGGARQ